MFEQSVIWSWHVITSIFVITMGKHFRRVPDHAFFAFFFSDKDEVKYWYFIHKSNEVMMYVPCLIVLHKPDQSHFRILMPFLSQCFFLNTLTSACYIPLRFLQLLAFSVSINHLFMWQFWFAVGASRQRYCTPSKGNWRSTALERTSYSGKSTFCPSSWNW